MTLAVALSSWNDAVTVPDPLDTAVTTPLGLAEKTSGALPVQVTVPGNGAPYWSARVAVNTVVSPTKVRVALEGDTAIAAARRGTAVGSVAGSPQPMIGLRRAARRSGLFRKVMVSHSERKSSSPRVPTRSPKAETYRGGWHPGKVRNSWWK